MKSYTKNKSILMSALIALILVAACFCLTACGSDSLDKLTSDNGFEIVGGDFEKGSVLNTDKVEITSDTADEIFKKLNVFGVEITDKTKAVIYDIFVSKDGKKTQPSGKVTVNVSITGGGTNGYKVFHLKSDNEIEEVTATYKNGVLSFETSGFSYYVFVANEAVNPMSSNPAAGSEAEWNSAITYWAAQTNVKVTSRYTSDSYDPQTGAQIEICQFDGTAYSEDGYFENEPSSQEYKGKIFYYVKEGDSYSRVEWQDEGNDDWILVKSNYLAEEGYKWSIENNIYACRDFYGEKIDFSYSNFTYDATTKMYKNKDNNVTVAFTFENGTLTKIAVTVVLKDDGYNSINERTITFGNAVVNVPTDENSD